MKKIDELFNLYSKQFGILIEDVNSSLNGEKFKFNKEDNGIIVCSFDINVDNNAFDVLAKYIDGKSTFQLTSSTGEEKIMSETDFAKAYYMDYDDYKIYLKDFLEKNKSDSLFGSGIQKFDDVLKKEVETSGDKFKEIVVKGNKFAFKKVEDSMIENYYECSFNLKNENNEDRFYKALVLMKEKNSTIMKIMIFDDEGNLLEPITTTMLFDKDRELYFNLNKAIIKMSKYLIDTNKL